MLTRLKVEGYRSIESLDLAMGPLTVLIGPNGSGKSNLLDVFDLLSSAAGGELASAFISRGGFGPVYFSDAQRPVIGFKLEFDRLGTFGSQGAPVVFEVELAPNTNLPFVVEESLRVGEREHADSFLIYGPDAPEGYAFRDMTNPSGIDQKLVKTSSELGIQQVRDEARYPYASKFSTEVHSWQVYPPFFTGKQAPLRRPQVVRAGMRLDSDGENLASVLFDIQNRDPDAWEQILDVLQTAYPGFKSLSFPSEGGDGTIHLRWREEPFTKKSGLSANVLSDGTLRLLMLLAILMTPDPPPLVCIDEPELGLHPDWIEMIGELLQSAATRTQLVVSTHSPELVSKMQPSQVVVVEKDNGRTVTRRLSDDEFTHWLDKFRLGDLWRAGHMENPA